MCVGKFNQNRLLLGNHQPWEQGYWQNRMLRHDIGGYEWSGIIIDKYMSLFLAFFSIL